MFQKTVFEGIKTHILYPITFFEVTAVYEVMWKDVVELDGPQMTMWRMCMCMCIVFWILMATIMAIIRNTCSLSTTTMVALTYLIVRLFMHCLSCSHTVSVVFIEIN